MRIAKKYNIKWDEIPDEVKQTREIASELGNTFRSVIQTDRRYKEICDMLNCDGNC